MFFFAQFFIRCLSLFSSAIAANYYLAPGFLSVCVAFLIIRWYYIRTARDVKRLEALGMFTLVICCLLLFYS